jgi:Secretion system C-terminal sorting domain
MKKLIPAGILALLFCMYACEQKKIILGDASVEGSIGGRKAFELLRLADPSTGKIPLYIRALELEFASHLPGDNQINGLHRSTSTANWQNRGPWNVGGRTRAFAMDATNPNVLVAGSASGGMYRSTDGGVSWTRTTNPAQHFSVTCLIQDTRAGHENVWYYGSGEAYGQSASGGGAYYLGYGIYKSVDSAKTWTALPSTIVGSPVSFDAWGDISWDIAIDPSNLVNDVVYVAAYGSIQRSVNGGNSWSLVKGVFASPASYFTDIEVTQGGVVYCTMSSDGSAANEGIWRSTDGINYTSITPAGFPLVYDRLKIGISPSDENQIYILGHTPGYGQADTNFVGDVEWNSLWKYWYISGNGAGAGGQWEDRSANLPTTGGLFDKFQSQGSYDIVVNVKPNDTNVVIIGGTNLYRSTDQFKSSTQTTHIGGYLEGATLPIVDGYPVHHPDQHVLFFDPANADIMYSANDGGVFRTDDNTATPVVWNSLNNGYLTTQFYTCAIDHASTSNIVIAGAQDNGTWFINSTNPLDPWVTPRGGDGSYCAIADNSGSYYFSIQNGKMMRAKVNAAGVIDSFARIDPIGVSNFLFINPYVLDPNNNNIMYMAGGRNLWRNDNLAGIPYAQNWDSISTNWTKLPDSTASASVNITAVAVSKTPANRVYYGTSTRKVYRVDNANTTAARTEITALSGTVTFPISGYVSCIAIDPTNADHVIVAFSNYGVYSLYYSTDAGTTWQKIGGNLEANINGSGSGPSVRWVNILPVSNGTVYLVGTSTGLYATSQLNGTSTVWVQQGVNNIGSVVVDMIDSRTTDGLVVVATHGNGIYSTFITDINDIVSAKEIESQSIYISANPNPSFGDVMISFNQVIPEKVMLQVFDQNGSVVMFRDLGMLQPGKQDYRLERGKLRSGIYYISINNGKRKGVQKVVLL